MENWRSYKFFDGWIMKKIEHTYNFNFKNKYRLNQPMSECKYTYCCDSLDNSLSLCEETSFYSSETPTARKDRRKLKRKKLVKKMRRNDDRYKCYTSSESEEDYWRRRKKHQRVFIHQKIIYDEYISKKDRKFYPTKLKMLSQEKWNQDFLKKKDKEEKKEMDDRAEKEKYEVKNKGDREETKMENDTMEGDGEAREESVRPHPPPGPGEAGLPPPGPGEAGLPPPGPGEAGLPPPLPVALALPPPPPPPPPPPLPPLPPTVRLLVNNGGYLPIQQMSSQRPTRQYNEQLPYGAVAGIAYEIPVDITYVIGCNVVFRQF